MRTHRVDILIFLLLAALTLPGCTGPGPVDPPTQVGGQQSGAGQPAGPGLATPAPTSAGDQAQLAATPTTPAETRTRGAGDFNLLMPATGLDSLSSYEAVLEMAFEGTRDGAPYQLKKSYTLVVDRAAGARSLIDFSTAADGTVSQVFSAAFAGVRYLQPALDQPCHASVLDPQAPLDFEPALILPLVEGASAAGTEQVNGVEADVYTFDALALNTGPSAKAAGTIWVARPGGWVVKYELGLRSETFFGAGIIGEQRWSYNLTGAGATQVGLPDSCPQGQVDLPLPEGAQVKASLPNFMQLTVAQAPDALVSFYTGTLTAQAWIQQGEPVTGQSGTRLVFSKPVGEKEQVAVITLQPHDGGTAVTIQSLLADPVQEK